MTRPAAQFLVYACEACGKRVFTERSHVGRAGACPCCGAQHVVGGIQTAEEGENRRRAPRVELPDAQVVIERPGSRSTARFQGGGSPAATSPVESFPLGDLSETGAKFRIPAVADRRRLSGYRPSPLQEGEVVEVALFVPGRGRPRTFRSEVRRVQPGPHKGTYEVGVQFVGLDETQRAELASIVRRLGEQAT